MAQKSETKKGVRRTVALIGAIATTYILSVFVAPLFVSANPIQNLEVPVKRPQEQRQEKKQARTIPPSLKPAITPRKKIIIPDHWSMLEIEKARKICAPILSNANAEFELIDPMRKGPCGTPAPIKLKALGTSVRVKISPPASLNCNMVRALHQWLERHVQPGSIASFNSNVIEIRNISSYSCRHRYNNPKKRLSEHALANALDIAGLKLANGKYVSLLKHWGETKRDRARVLARAQAKAQAKAEAQARAKAEARLNTTANSGDRTAAGQNGAKAGQPEWETAIKANRPIKASVRVVVPPKAHLDARARFLRKLHVDACSIFGTVLGPEANEAHRNHYHFDLAPRRRSAYCE